MAVLRYPGLKFLLFGNSFILDPILQSIPALRAHCEVIHTDVVVASDAKPSIALRQGRQSSMRLAIDAVKDGRASAVVSAGNTGALMAMSKIVMRTLPGISRPAIAALFPTMRGECAILDLGANVVCDATDLFHFAIMGDAFARAVLGLSRPRIGLLNVGSEEEKGHEEVKAAAALLRNSDLNLNFHGFVEGNDIAMGTADVVVTDGFTGNVALKTAEGTAKLIRHYLKGAFRSSAPAMAGAMLARAALGTVKEKLDERNRNGAMFLGLSGIAVKSHGGADAYSFCNAIGVALELVTHNINGKITEELARLAEATKRAPANDGYRPLEPALSSEVKV
jgi:glycerol-3-phosphate acyltransferase PlsX